MYERIITATGKAEWASGAEKRTEILEQAVIPSIMEQMGELSEEGSIFLNRAVGHLSHLCGSTLGNLLHLNLYAARNGISWYGSAHEHHTEDTMKVSQAILNALTPETNLKLADKINDWYDRVRLLQDRELALIEIPSRRVKFATLIPGITVTFAEIFGENYVSIERVSV